MNKIFKRGCAVFLAMATAFSLLSTVSLAAEDGTANEGTLSVGDQFIVPTNQPTENTNKKSPDYYVEQHYMTFEVTENTGTNTVKVASEQAWCLYYYVFTNYSTKINEYPQDQRDFLERFLKKDYYRDSIEIPDTVDYNGVTYTVTSIGEYAFYECEDLSEVTIPSTVESIEEYAFYGCSGLANISLSEGLKTIGDFAFWDCDSLTEVTIPNTVSKIGEDAFEDCQSLEKVNLLSENPPELSDKVFDGCADNFTVYVPAIYSSNYSDDESWNNYNTVSLAAEYVTANEGTLSVGDQFTVPTNQPTKEDQSITNIIKYLTFEVTENTSTNTVKVASDQPQCLYNYVFNNFSDKINKYSQFQQESFGMFLKNDYYCNSIKIPETVDYNGVTYTVTSIGDYAFESCEELDEVFVPETVKTIERHAFYSCCELANISLSEGLETIGDFAFWDCDSLTEVTIPKTVSKIGEDAFEDCQNLKAVNSLPAEPPELKNGEVFDGCADNFTVYVYKEYVETYQNSSYWSKYTIHKYW